MKTDVLVIGSGIAGLFFAIKTARKRNDLKIAIISKDKAEVTNTRYAQGGIATVVNAVTDSFEKHVQDTLAAGRGFCNESIVRMVVEQAPDRLRELIGLGVQFDRTGSGNLNLGLEGGHSQPRIVHYKDITGFEIERALLDAADMLQNISLLEERYATALLKDNGQCCGAEIIDEKGNVKQILARVVVLATGGCGQLFSHTTNPPIASGDGVALACNIGAKIADMRYIQFHPTALYEPGNAQYFLLSEALRGYGAHLVNAEGKRFAFKYDQRGELATRDVVTGAIKTEMAATNADCMYLDCRHLDQHALRTDFPTIYHYCTLRGYYPGCNLLPVVPVAHYQCGGIATDEHAHTTVPHLYAIGECARTGLHGANRLASNSLLEAVVFAHQAANAVCSTIDHIALAKVLPACTDSRSGSLSLNRMQELRRRLNAKMDTLFLEPEKFDPAAFATLTAEIEKQCAAATTSRMARELQNMTVTARLVVNDVLATKSIILK